MKKLLQNKRFILALIVVPNLIITFLTNGNNALYTLGAAFGAATVVYLIYYASRILLSKPTSTGTGSFRSPLPADTESITPACICSEPEAQKTTLTFM